MSQTLWQNYEKHMSTSFEDWYASKDCTWKQVRGLSFSHSLSYNLRSISSTEVILCSNTCIEIQTASHVQDGAYYSVCLSFGQPKA